MRRIQRFAPVPWGEIAPSDLEPQGEPETCITYRHEEHIGLHVRGVSGVTLGMLAVKCERRGLTVWPQGLAIADAPIAIDTNLHSNPRRHADDDGA